MSLLMVVQPLLDAGKNMASGASGKNQGGDGNPFQALLQGQIASRQPEKQIMSQPGDSKEAVKQPSSNDAGNKAGEAKSDEPVKEGAPAGETASGKVEDEGTVSEDAAVLAQIMAAAVGAQIVPVEPVPGNDAAELAEDADTLVLAADVDVDADAGKKLAAAEIETVTGKEGAEEAADDAVYGKVQADAEESMATPVEKPTVETAAAKAAPDTAAAAAVKPAADQQQAVQTQQQPTVPSMQAQQVQQAQVAPMATQADPAASRVMQQLGTPEWNQAISQRVLWMVGQEQQSASLTLNPPELGPVRVVVSVSNNNASANFFSANPDVRQALEGSLPRLREMMEGAGIQLGQAQVGAEGSGNPESGHASSSGRTAGLQGSESDSAGLSAVTTDTPVTGRKVGRGLVDTFA
ncbi:flagellar hook-length control protein FliK [Oxalobacter sp. OttesenSCG-928-P03]|nr:flagellar hook-length control protein FliK [Oxalobacter sp. OttesenSCG-928-P03]